MVLDYIDRNFIPLLGLIFLVTSCGSVTGVGGNGRGDTSSVGEISHESQPNNTVQDNIIGDNSITVYFANDIGPVNKQVFGSALEGWDYDHITNPNGETIRVRTNYGMGIWDPDTGETVKNVINLAKNAGLSALRFTTTNFYEWKKAVGLERTEFLFGIDEFMTVAEEIGAEPIFTIGYMYDDPKDAADLVEYLNMPNDGNYFWATKRAENGHDASYNVLYFEIGNEMCGYWLGLTPEEYGNRYLEYYDAMKSVDPNIKIGISLGPYSWWDPIVLEIISNKVDFGIMHIYPKPPGFSIQDERIKTMDPSDIFSLALATPTIKYEHEVKATLDIMKQNSGRDIPLIISEYNGGFSQNEPIKYRYSLGTALINAELLRIFMKPENNILMANNHSFVNGSWGMIRSEEPISNNNYMEHGNYIKRPNYFVYELYHNHFGQTLIKAEVASAEYDIRNIPSFESKMLYYVTGTETPYLTVTASKNINGEKVFIMVINKSMDKYMKSLIELKDLPMERTGEELQLQVDTWVLNGPDVVATNEEIADIVKPFHKGFSVSESSFKMLFEPHSLTAVEITLQQSKDDDNDGVINSKDLCAETFFNAVVDPGTGCSIDQFCPCEGPRGRIVSWRNHGMYVSCVAQSAESFVEMELITDSEKEYIVSSAAQSLCGNKK